MATRKKGNDNARWTKSCKNSLLPPTTNLYAICTCMDGWMDVHVGTNTGKHLHQRTEVILRFSLGGQAPGSARIEVERISAGRIWGYQLCGSHLKDCFDLDLEMPPHARAHAHDISTLEHIITITINLDTMILDLSSHQPRLCLECARWNLLGDACWPIPGSHFISQLHPCQSSVFCQCALCCVSFES